MRSVFQHILIAFSFLFIMSCANNDIAGIDNDISTRGDYIHFEINFAGGGSAVPQLRAATDAEFNSTWEDGDAVGIFAVRRTSGDTGSLSAIAAENYYNNAKLTYSADDDEWTTIEGLYFPQNGDVLDFYAYYPYDASATDPTSIVFNASTDQHLQTGGKSNYNLSDFMIAKSDNSGNGYSKSAGVVSLTFSHALAMVQVKMDNSNGAVDPYKQFAILQGVKTKAIFDLGGSGATVLATENNDATDIKMYRLEQPGDANYMTDFTYRALVPEQTIAAGSKLFLFSNGKSQCEDSAQDEPLELTAANAEVFSRSLPYTVMLTPEANSYMIRPNGASILIPAMSMANKAVDPAHNLGADAAGLGGVTSDNYTVELVWGDAPIGEAGVIKGMSAEVYNGQGYINVKPGVSGNAVVCIKVGGVVKWSWHIWVTEPVGEGTDVVTGLTWMDRNLGAAGTTYDTSGKNGLFYQWGRKDAFPGSDGTNNNQTYYIGSEASGIKTPISTANNYTKLFELVHNPFVFATNHTSYRGSINDASATNNSWGGVSGEKTIYDPCPTGWKVPSIAISGTNSWGSNNISDWTSISRGQIFNGVNGVAVLEHFYPASGLRQMQSGVVWEAGSRGYYYSSTSTNTHAYRMEFYNTSVNPDRDANYRGSGFAIRCVSE